MRHLKAGLVGLPDRRRPSRPPRSPTASRARRRRSTRAASKSRSSAISRRAIISRPMRRASRGRPRRLASTCTSSRASRTRPFSASRSSRRSALGVQGIIVSHGQPEAVKDVIQKARRRRHQGGRQGHRHRQSESAAGLAERSRHRPAGARSGAEGERRQVQRRLCLRRRVPAARAARRSLGRGQEGAIPAFSEKAAWGAVNSNTATTVASQTAAALRAHPEITVVFAPYDEFARGVKLGAAEAGVADKIKVYSADVSTSDIQEIREPGSPWVATSATNPAVVGEVSLRALALLIAGQDPGKVDRGEARPDHARGRSKRTTSRPSRTSTRSCQASASAIWRRRHG